MAKRKIYHFKDGGTLVFKKSKINKAIEAHFYVSPGARIDEIYGLSHFYEHMLFNGTSTRSREELIDLGRIHNAEQNAATSSKNVYLRFYCPSSEFEQILAYNAEMLLHSIFSEKDIENEKKIISEEILRAEDDNARNLNIFHRNTTVGFKQTNLPSLGTTETISTITRDDLLAYQKKWITKSNFVAVVVGNISFRKVKKLIQAYFLNHMPNGEKQEYYNPDNEILLPNSNLGVMTKDIKKTNYRLSVPSFGFLSDDKTKVIESFLSSILNNQGLVIRKLRHENGLVYSSGISILRYANTGMLSFEVSTSKANILQSFEVIGEIVKELLFKGISQEDLDYAKKNIKLQESKQLPQLKGSCERLYFQYNYNLPIKNEKYWKKIENSITLQDMNNYIQTVFRPQKVFLSVIGNITEEELPNIEYFEKLFQINQEKTDS